MTVDKKIIGIYASTSGNVELVVDCVADILKQNDIEIELHRAELAPLDIFTRSDTFLIATSTWGHGILNPFFVNIYKEIQKTDLSGKKAAFIGLGDARYEEAYFNEGIEIMKRVFWGAKGTEIHRTLKLNGEPHKYLDLLVKKWALDLTNVLKNVK